MRWTASSITSASLSWGARPAFPSPIRTGLARVTSTTCASTGSDAVINIVIVIVTSCYCYCY